MTAASDELVRLHAENGVATVTLNQPERRNSLSMALLEALSEVLEHLREYKGRVVFRGDLTKDQDNVHAVFVD